MPLSPVARCPPITPAARSPVANSPTAVTAGSCPVAWNFYILTTAPRPFWSNPNSAGIWRRTGSANRNVNAKSRPSPDILSIRFQQGEAKQCDNYDYNLFHTLFLIFDQGFAVKFIYKQNADYLCMEFYSLFSRYSSLSIWYSSPGNVLYNW